MTRYISLLPLLLMSVACSKNTEVPVAQQSQPAVVEKEAPVFSTPKDMGASAPVAVAPEKLRVESTETAEFSENAKAFDAELEKAEKEELALKKPDALKKGDELATEEDEALTRQRLNRLEEARLLKENRNLEQENSSLFGDESEFGGDEPPAYAPDSRLEYGMEGRE